MTQMGGQSRDALWSAGPQRGTVERGTVERGTVERGTVERGTSVPRRPWQKSGRASLRAL